MILIIEFCDKTCYSKLADYKSKYAVHSRFTPKMVLYGLNRESDYEENARVSMWLCNKEDRL